MASSSIECRIPIAIEFGDRQRGAPRAARKVGQQARLLRLGAGVQDRIGGEHRGREIGRAEQRAAQLLGHDAKLDHAEAGATVLLGEVYAGQREFLAKLTPHRRIVTLGRGHQTPNLGGRRFVTQESPDRRAELFLFIRKGELDAARGFQTGLCCSAHSFEKCFRPGQERRTCPGSAPVWAPPW